VIDQTGAVLLSKRVENDENALLELIATIAKIADGREVCWATDLNAGGAALLIELLAAHAQQLLYIPGRIVHHAAATYRGDGKTAAKDARIIADQARMRADLQPVRGADQIRVDLRLLTARRTDLICDRVRSINRLRATLLEYFPALERAFAYSKKAPLILLGGYQTPEGIRRIGLARLTGWLRKRGCRNSAKMAEKALIAANSQHTVLPTQTTGSALDVRLAEQIGTLDAEIADVDAQITELFRQHDSARVLLTMPGFGPVLAATFLANIGGSAEGQCTHPKAPPDAGECVPEVGLELHSGPCNHWAPAETYGIRSQPGTSTARSEPRVRTLCTPCFHLLDLAVRLDLVHDVGERCRREW
jgi:transposase